MTSLGARNRWIILLVVVSGLVVARPEPADAAPSAAQGADDGCIKEPDCRDHYQRAIGLYESGRYEAALPEFEAAYQSRQMPWLLINIGRTLHRLGRLDEAITFYNRYEQASPNGDPETTKKVREYKAQAEVLLNAKGAASSTSTPPTGTPTDKGSASPSEPRPLYKKWWFWTAIGGGVAVIVIAGIAIGVGTSHSSSLPDGVPTYMPTFP
jgi:tetratricopeptide (TPR) repeat protein